MISQEGEEEDGGGVRLEVKSEKPTKTQQ